MREFTAATPRLIWNIQINGESHQISPLRSCMASHGPILVVDDEPDSITLLQHAFDKAGIRNPVLVFNDGESAITYLAGTGKYNDRAVYPLPDIVLLDWKLPRWSGREVILWIRRQEALRALPIVVCSGSNLSRDVGDAYAAGANSYVTKPAALSELIEFAIAFRSFWLLQCELPVCGEFVECNQ